MRRKSTLAAGFFCCCLSAEAAIPTGIFVHTPADGAPTERLECTGGAECFLWQRGQVLTGIATEEQGRLTCRFGERFQVTLLAQGPNWIDPKGDRWQPREQLAAPGADWTPVTLRVTDQRKQLIPGMTCRYTLVTSRGTWDPLLVRPLQATGKSLTFTFDAPADCRIQLEMEHPDLVHGYGANPVIARKAGAAGLSATVKKGGALSGRVVDAATGKPVAGARVAPRIFTPPNFAADPTRVVETPADGSFKLRGLSDGVVVRHPDYLEQQVPDAEASTKPRTIRLATGVTVAGKVHDSVGRPLAGVEVSDGSGKTALTAADGAFTLRGVQKSFGKEWSFSFRKDGYDSVSMRPKTVPAPDWEIVLPANPVLRGRVLLPDGSPAASFRLNAGPGAEPYPFETAEGTFTGANGIFELPLKQRPEKEGDPIWLGVQSPAAAPWDGAVALDELSDGRYEIHLAAGHSLRAHFQLPPGAKDGLTALIHPTDREWQHLIGRDPNPAQTLATLRLKPAADGQVSFPHLRPGAYRLSLRGAGITPSITPFTVSDRDLDLGEIAVAGTGSISGVAYDPDQPGQRWRFAAGEVRVADGAEAIPFKTDAQGIFQVSEVPTGLVTVSLPHPLTADVIGEVSRTARVLENKDTEIRFDPAKSTPLALRFGAAATPPAFKEARKVANVTDREPDFRFEALPAEPGPASWPHESSWSPSDKDAPALPGLTPGRWKVRVYDWLGSRGFDEGLRAEAVLDTTSAVPTILQLGTGCLSGKVTTDRELRHFIQIAAVATRGGRTYYSRCDGTGSFVVRYLPADDYHLYAHDPDAGWSDLGTATCTGTAAVVDCGEKSLGDGAQASGSLGAFATPGPLPLRLAATGPGGLVLTLKAGNDGSYRLENFPPGVWTVRASHDERPIAESQAELVIGQNALFPPMKPLP